MTSIDPPRSEPIETSIAPWLSVAGATDAVDYYKAAFGAIERYRLEDDPGDVVGAHLALGGAGFRLQEDADFSRESLGGLSVRMILTVQDPDSVFKQAIASGATEVAA